MLANPLKKMKFDSLEVLITRQPKFFESITMFSYIIISSSNDNAYPWAFWKSNLEFFSMETKFRNTCSTNGMAATVAPKGGVPKA